MTQNNIGKAQISKIKAENHIATGLKRHLREFKQEIAIKDEEISRLKKNIKMTKFIELENEVKAYIDE